ncbi:MAG TPA: flagellar biosynthesis protein FlhB [Spirochaetota bacterium]|mgnify:FL=1|nr:flagellar biosynthesis protein FlhB [Spirochaetota bacterium]HOS56552.1 flagellar biosynthesis protein FlhB [Spirochaetota bacterium]HQF78857.1 flagellar biosynthesis protein FlhB [Spirochaetota bacterium]HQH30514.1 flagellar biosynthesis protein FlhB [Spirochaetota bacterium]HQJ04810.1 flagellar biosynthesis protein FlhB [Spirochaetota bacterium]
MEHNGLFLRDDLISYIYGRNSEIIFDLQRFASAESEGRTEKPTEHKIRKAREEGRVALSKDLPASLISLFSFVAIYFFAKYIFDILISNMDFILENATNLELSGSNVYYNYLLIPIIKIFAPIAIVAFIIGVLSNYMQIGFKVTPKAIKPNFKKISPNVFKFFKNQVFSFTGFFNLFKSVVKVVIIGIVAYLTITGEMDRILGLINEESLFQSIIFILKLAFDIILKSTIILTIFAILDIFFVRWQYEEQLKMKKQEIKEEYKELYGDPNVKSRLKQMYQQLLSEKKMLEEVPNADVVITNPTHYAVALRYKDNQDNAPKVTAKGKDQFAMKIKEVARENDIFMYENVPLARTLYNDVEVNSEIPRELYGMVIQALILAYKHKQKEEVV